MKAHFLLQESCSGLALHQINTFSNPLSYLRCAFLLFARCFCYHGNDFLLPHCIFLLLLSRLSTAESVLLNPGHYIAPSIGACPSQPLRSMPTDLNYLAKISKLVAIRICLSFHLTFVALTVPLRSCLFSHAHNKVLIVSVWYYLSLQSQTDFFLNFDVLTLW